ACLPHRCPSDVSNRRHQPREWRRDGGWWSFGHTCFSKAADRVLVLLGRLRSVMRPIAVAGDRETRTSATKLFNIPDSFFLTMKLTKSSREMHIGPDKIDNGISSSITRKLDRLFISAELVKRAGFQRQVRPSRWIFRAHSQGNIELLDSFLILIGFMQCI